MITGAKLLNTKNEFINFLYFLGILVAIPLVTISMLRGIKTGFFIANYVHIAILILFIFIYVIRKKINYTIKSLLIIIILLIVGVIGLFSYATFATDIMTLLFFVFVSSILLGHRAGIAAISISGLTILVFAISFSNNFINLSVDPMKYIKDSSSWLDILISFLLFSIIIIYLIHKFYEELNNTINDLEAKTNSLNIEKERLAVIFSSINESIITTDKNGVITFINKQAEELTAYKKEELIEKDLSVFKILNENTQEEIKNIFELIVKNDLDHIKSILLVNKREEYLNIVFTASLIEDLNKKTVGVIVVFRDVTEKRIRAKEAFKLKKLESVGFLAGGIAHDFNNLLLGIVGNLDLAQVELEDKNIQNANNNINDSLKACMEATYLTHKLLTFSKGGKPIKEIISLSQIIKDSLYFLSSGQDMETSIDIAKDLWEVSADKNQINQVIQSLILNSIEAFHKNKKIKISCINKTFLDDENSVKKGDYIEITIVDTGAGISKDNLQKVFDPYFTTKGEGKGLGLSIAYSIIKNHRGYIHVYSELNKGATFKVYLPANSSSKDTTNSELIIASKNSKDIIVQGGKKKKILIMDDDEMIRIMLDKVLTKLNYRVTMTKSGEEAVEAYKKRKYDLSIFDITVLNGMNGDKAASIILEFDKNAKIIASSGYSNEASIARYKKIGFYDFISKPYRIEEIKDKIKSILT